MKRIICGIDPGLTGALVFIGKTDMLYHLTPLNSKKEVDFHSIRKLLLEVKPAHVFLERAIPFAMGSKGAFNYGRGFAALELAIQDSGLPVTYVEPAKWTKAMHEGINSDLRPKAKSIIAVERLYPHFIEQIPKVGKKQALHEGVTDALLIAGFGERSL